MEIHPIRNDDDHAAALREIENLWGAAVGSEEGDKLDILSTLVEKYEEGRWPNIDDSDPVELSSTLVSWESKDGLRYRFNERRLKNGEPDEEVRGEARLDGPGKGGKADFTKPEATTLTLEPNVLFPTARDYRRAASGTTLHTSRWTLSSEQHKKQAGGLE